jgi:adenylate/nucleoside-diphosphate kinase
LFVLGSKGSGKTLYGRHLAEKLGVFHIDFQERLQELIIAKTGKRVGPDFEDEEDENANENDGSKCIMITHSRV